MVIAPSKPLHRFFYVTISILILSTVLTTAVLSWSEYRRSQKDTAIHHRCLLRCAASGIGFFMNDSLAGLESLGKILSSGVDPGQEKDVLASFVPKNNQFLAVSLYDDRGRLIGSTETDREDVAVSDSPLFVGALRGKTGVSSVRGHESRIPFLYLAVPVYRQGTIYGVLWGEVSLVRVRHVLEDSRIDCPGRMYIADLSEKDGGECRADFVLTAPPAERPQILSETKAAPEPVTWIGRRADTDTLCMGVSIDHVDWVLLLMLDFPDIYPILVRNAYLAAGISLVLLLLTAVIGQVLLPVQNSHDGPQRVGNGDTVPTTCDYAEIGDLAGAFNDMVASCRQFLRREQDSGRESADAGRPEALGTAAGRVTHEISNLINNLGLAAMVLEKEESLSDRGGTALSVFRKESIRLQGFLRIFMQFPQSLGLHSKKDP